MVTRYGRIRLVRKLQQSRMYHARYTSLLTWAYYWHTLIIQTYTNASKHTKPTHLHTHVVTYNHVTHHKIHTKYKHFKIAGYRRVKKKKRKAKSQCYQASCPSILNFMNISRVA